jgi:hypothetical protein
VSHAGSDLWSGFDNNQPSWFAPLPSQNPTRWHPQTQAFPCSSIPSSLVMSRWC